MASKRVSYAVRLRKYSNQDIIQPNYKLVVNEDATADGFPSGVSVKEFENVLENVVYTDFIVDQVTRDSTYHCGMVTFNTTVLSQDGTFNQLFTEFTGNIKVDNVITDYGGITLEFVKTDHRIDIYRYPGSTEYFVIQYRRGDTINGTLVIKFYNGAGVQTIPWYYPALTQIDGNVLHFYRFTATQRTRGYFIQYPEGGASNVIRWPCGTSWQPYIDRSHSDLTNVIQFFVGLIPIDENDPYINIPESEPSGPAESTGIPENDPIEIPDLPTVSVADTGFISLFNPSLTQVRDLAAYMWTGLFDLATYKKIFADPMDCILGFNMLPVAIPHGTAAAVRVGNISTGVQMNPATSQWVEVDCGTLDVGDAFGNYLSYAPYTKFSMYLPYIGIVELSADDVVGKTLALKYHVDVLSCSCVAYLKCGASVLYQFTGSCGYSIPVSGNDFRATVANIVSIAATVAGAVVTGGAAAGITAGTTAKAAAKAARMKAAQTAQHIGDAASIGKNVMGSKPEIHRSGAIGGSAGIMGMQKPYLIVEYPNPCKPEKQYHYTGYPSFVTVKLSDLSGYASFEEILIEGVPCTEEEQTMIKDLCMGGIYL